MHLNDWLDEQVPAISRELEAINRAEFFRERTIGFAGKEKVKRLIHQLRSALFPGIYERERINEDQAGILIHNSVRLAAMTLDELAQCAYRECCTKDTQQRREPCGECARRAAQVVRTTIGALPTLRRQLQADIQAAYYGDPAATSPEEIMLSYPTFEAISIHRLAHVIHQCQLPMIPRMMSEYAHQRTGIDIHPGATIGESFFIDHGTGVVIGETCTIGNHVKIYQGVTLGARSFDLDADGNPVKGVKRHPDIDDHVVIYAGATVLGGDTRIGHHSIIGGNVWLTRSVPPYSMVHNAQPSPAIRDVSPKTQQEL
ncbi:MAG: serine acetyltransferase [Eubacteriales bacterium]|nr:serine acetyltransferase [Eubacteriales bacterium]